MVYIDRPRTVYFRGRYRRTVHCTARQLDELHDFVLQLGHQRRFFQDLPGKPHYDLFDEMIEQALALGAVQVPNRDFVLLLRRWHRPWDADYAASQDDSQD